MLDLSLMSPHPNLTKSCKLVDLASTCIKDHLSRVIPHSIESIKVIEWSTWNLRRLLINNFGTISMKFDFRQIYQQNLWSWYFFKNFLGFLFESKILTNICVLTTVRLLSMGQFSENNFSMGWSNPLEYRTSAKIFCFLFLGIYIW